MAHPSGVFMLIIRALLTPYRLRPSFAAILLVSGTIFISEANAQESQTPPFKFATALTTAESLPRMRSLLISRNGDLVRIARFSTVSRFSL